MLSYSKHPYFGKESLEKKYPSCIQKTTAVWFVISFVSIYDYNEYHADTKNLEIRPS